MEPSEGRGLSLVCYHRIGWPYVVYDDKSGPGVTSPAAGENWWDSRGLSIILDRWNAIGIWEICSQSGSRRARWGSQCCLGGVTGNQWEALKVNVVGKLLKLWRIDPSVLSLPLSHSLTFSTGECKETLTSILLHHPDPVKGKRFFKVDVIAAVWRNLQRSPFLGGASKCQSGAEAGAGVGAEEYRRSNKSPGRLPGSLFL